MSRREPEERAVDGRAAVVVAATFVAGCLAALAAARWRSLVPVAAALLPLAGFATWGLALRRWAADRPTVGPRPTEAQPARGPGVVEGAGGVGLVLLAMTVRALWPDSPWLAWVLAPAAVLVAPGLGVAAALMPDARLGERLAWAAPLSFCALALALGWSNLLGVSVDAARIEAACLLFAAVGPVTTAVRRRRA